jgi:hypothetical protein
MGGGGAGDGAPNVVIEAERRDQPQGGPTSAPPRM